MKISKRSWHYRLLKQFTPDDKSLDGNLPHKSLCDYVWDLFSVFLFLLAVGWIFLLITPFALLTDWLEKRKKAKSPTPKPVVWEPKTLLGKWWKARKEKVCPILEWEE